MGRSASDPEINTDVSFMGIGEDPFSNCEPSPFGNRKLFLVLISSQTFAIDKLIGL